MAFDLAGLPNVAVRPSNASGSEVRARLVEASRMNRRTLWKLTLGTAMATSMAGVTVVATGRRAYAADLYSTWHSCLDYNAGGVDPDGDWNVCNPNGSAAGYIGASYCKDGWHRDDAVVDDTCTRRQYNVAYRCTGDNGTNKNAWEWHVSNNPNPPNPPDVRCSDGTFRRMVDCDWLPWHNSTCKKPI